MNELSKFDYHNFEKNRSKNDFESDVVALTVTFFF